MATKEDIIELQSIFDDRYVKQNDCNERQEKVNSRFANDDKRIERQEAFNESLKKFLWIGISALVGEVIISLLTLIQGGIGVG